jgi:hypothetical protein
MAVGWRKGLEGEGGIGQAERKALCGVGSWAGRWVGECVGFSLRWDRGGCAGEGEAAC